MPLRTTPREFSHDVYKDKTMMNRSFKPESKIKIFEQEIKNSLYNSFYEVKLKIEPYLNFKPQIRINPEMFQSENLKKIYNLIKKQKIVNFDILIQFCFVKSKNGNLEFISSFLLDQLTTNSKHEVLVDDMALSDLKKEKNDAVGVDEEGDDEEGEGQGEREGSGDNKGIQETNILKENEEIEVNKEASAISSNIFPLLNMELNNDCYKKVSHLVSLVKTDHILSQQNIILSSQDFFNFQKGSLLQHAITLCNWFQAIDNDLVKSNHITNLVLFAQNKSKCFTSYVMRIGKP